MKTNGKKISDKKQCNSNGRFQYPIITNGQINYTKNQERNITFELNLQK